jgi:Ni,Fe-hydrogenase III large subunit
MWLIIHSGVFLHAMTIREHVMHISKSIAGSQGGTFELLQN